MGHHRTGCLICGKELKYSDQAKTFKCAKCGKEFESTAACEDGHFVCDACHYQAGYEFVNGYALRAESKNPVSIANKMMENEFINMHGPEHHYLIVAALLAAYKNSGGQIDLEKSLITARERAGKVPGGVCGFWGCCGAGVGSGIFVSLITGATPLSAVEWGLANQMTSLSLAAISRKGGPRCCKRDTYLAILSAIDFVKEHFKVEMEKPETIKCKFFVNNPSCKKEECDFHPKKER